MISARSLVEDEATWLLAQKAWYVQFGVSADVTCRYTRRLTDLWSSSPPRFTGLVCGAANATHDEATKALVVSVRNRVLLLV